VIYFEWDPAKAEINLRKHGVSFGLATDVFRDPQVIIEKENIAEGEQRWKAVGMADSVICLLVVHTFEAQGGDDETIRLISVRRASRKERKQYEDQVRQYDGL
jgi:uncharacterized DUF497 family protein